MSSGWLMQESRTLAREGRGESPSELLVCGMRQATERGCGQNGTWTCLNSSKRNTLRVGAGKSSRTTRFSDLPIRLLMISTPSPRPNRSQTCNPALDESLEEAEVEHHPNSTTTKSFIEDHLASMDFCRNPDLLRLVRLCCTCDSFWMCSS